MHPSRKYSAESVGLINSHIVTILRLSTGTLQGTQRVGTSSNLVWARGQGLRNTGGGDTVETEESVEQDRDETVGYNSFPNTKLIFETCLYRIRSRSRSPLLWFRQRPSCDRRSRSRSENWLKEGWISHFFSDTRFAKYSSLVYSGVVENFPALIRAITEVQEEGSAPGASANEKKKADKCAGIQVCF